MSIAFLKAEAFSRKLRGFSGEPRPPKAKQSRKVYRTQVANLKFYSVLPVRTIIIKLDKKLPGEILRWALLRRPLIPNGQIGLGVRDLFINTLLMR